MEAGLMHEMHGCVEAVVELGNKGHVAWGHDKLMPGVMLLRVICCAVHKTDKTKIFIWHLSFSITATEFSCLLWPHTYTLSSFHWSESENHWRKGRCEHVHLKKSRMLKLSRNLAGMTYLQEQWTYTVSQTPVTGRKQPRPWGLQCGFGITCCH